MTYATKERIVTGAFVLLIALELMFLAAHPAHAAVADWFKGSSMVPRSTTDFGSEEMKRSLADLAATGANAVALIYPIYQDSRNSSQLTAGWNTPTDASLRGAIRAARELGLKVNIKLHAEVRDGTWRAHIKPDNRDEWYGSYSHHLMYLARVAQEEHAELITIGTEMVGTATWSEHGDNTRRWQEMIDGVRGVYAGKLTYAANSNDNSNSPYTNEKKYIAFWSSLDYASISAYYQLNSDASVEGMKGAWDWWNNNDLRGFQQSVGKPLLFGEIGYRSIDGARWAPWDWARGGAANQDEQANAYDALMSYWNTYDYMAGVFWWDWSTNPNAGGAGNTDYTPQNKKAEEVLSRWFKNPSQPGGQPSQTAFSSRGSANPEGTAVGNTVTLSAHITSLGTAPTSNTIVDIEIYNESNQKVFQQFYEGQHFGSSETRTYAPQWAPSAAGTYRMTVGVFSAQWGQAYHWNNAAATIAVSGSSAPPPPSTPPNPPPSSSTVNVWWPTQGTRVSGVQPVKAVIDGRDIESYSMYWEVDGSGKVPMPTSMEDWPHKEALIDYAGWGWKGAGPYTLTFIAESNGAAIGSKSVDIYTR